MADCNNPCIGADSCGVGYCKEHEYCSDVDPDYDYDRWWLAANLAKQRGDASFDDLEWEEWPPGMEPDL